MLSLIPAACAAMICAATPDAAQPVATLAPVMHASAVAGFAMCALPARTAAGAAAAKRTGPLGWLMRYNRDEDELERTRVAAPISYYLRSPLLTSFFANVPCPQAADKTAVESAEECATLLVRGRYGDDVIELTLPQYGATNAARLRSVVSDHQARGEAMHFSPNGYVEQEIPANAIREVQARACR
jgi:hypothetical protein